MSLFETGIRPAITEYLKKESEKIRDYGNYWSASSAGYCMRLQIMRRLGIPPVPEMEEDTDRRTRVFESGHIFHEWLQRITKDAGLSIASELELQDEDLMIRGHFDDLVLVSGEPYTESLEEDQGAVTEVDRPKHLILYDYKTAHSASFNYKKARTEIGHYHKYQLGTYMYMLRNNAQVFANAQSKNILPTHDGTLIPANLENLTEARILSISKDDLRMHEDQLLWTPDLEKEIVGYWKTLNGYWKEKKLPKCTCLDHDGGFMGKRSSKGKFYNDYFYNDEPCSLEWYKQWKSKKEEK